MQTRIKEKPINIKLTADALRILAEVAKELGISRTAAIELAVRKAFLNKEIYSHEAKNDIQK